MTLASGALARLVSYFAARPAATPHLRALMRHTGLTARSLQAELARLEGLGVVLRERAGGRVQVRGVESHPAWGALRQLARVLADPIDLLRLALVDVPGIQAAFVFGSEAKGTAGPESDLDVLVVAEEMDERLLARRTIDLWLLLGQEVNVVDLTPDALAAKVVAGRTFYREILRGPQRWVVGGLDRLPPAARAVTA